MTSQDEQEQGNWDVLFLPLHLTRSADGKFTKNVTEAMMRPTRTPLDEQPGAEPGDGKHTTGGTP